MGRSEPTQVENFKTHAVEVSGFEAKMLGLGRLIPPFFFLSLYILINSSSVGLSRFLYTNVYSFQNF